MFNGYADMWERLGVSSLSTTIWPSFAEAPEMYYEPGQCPPHLAEAAALLPQNAFLHFRQLSPMEAYLRGYVDSPAPPAPPAPLTLPVVTDGFNHLMDCLQAGIEPAPGSPGWHYQRTHGG